MSDTVLTVLIVAVAVVVILFMFRRQLSAFIFRANKEGVEAHLETRDTTAQDQTSGSAGRTHSVNISDNRQIGRDQEISVGRADTNVSDNLQLGEEQKIRVDPDPRSDKKKKR
jgi:hypothetical protein